MRSFILKFKSKLKTLIKIIHNFFNIYIYISSIKEKHNALKNKAPIIITPLKDNRTNQYLYQMSFFAEFKQYFNAKDLVLPKSKGQKHMFYTLDFAYFPINISYDDYFTCSIKSSERALIRKAIKNGYTCREIDYDAYLSDILEINTSKNKRQGEEMSKDYLSLKPRQKIVSSVGQKILSYGCFDSSGKLVAYYMFELFGQNTFHTVKGIGHSEHLNYGIMNYLFAFSIGELYKIYPDGSYTILYGGMSANGDGLSRFKRNVGCKLGSPCINASREFYNDLEKFNKAYKIHGDTGLNFILDNSDKFKTE